MLLELVSAALFSALAVTGTAGAAPAWVRDDDPVVVAGARLEGLLGVPLEHITVLACRDGGLTPIPFQIDEKRSDGAYAFTHGRSAARDEDPALDANDELVFMAVDAGPACDFVAPANVVNVVAVEARDDHGATRWGYAVSTQGAAPRSSVDYVGARADDTSKTWRVEGKTYRIEQVQNAIYYDYLSVRRFDGSWTENLVDRLKVRVDASLFFGTLKKTVVAEELYRQRVEAWIDGPVRVLVLAKGYLAPRRFIDMPMRGHALIVHYPTFIIFPVTVNTPIGFGALLTDMKVRSLNEFRKEAFGLGLHYYDRHNPYRPDVLIDGRVSEAEKALNTANDSRWIALVGEHGASVNRLVLPKSWTFAKVRLSAVEDSARREPPEAEPGTFGLGYEIDGLVNIPRGSHTIEVQYYFPEHFAVGDEQRILDIVDRPLTVATAPILLSPAGP